MDGVGHALSGFRSANIVGTCQSRLRTTVRLPLRGTGVAANLNLCFPVGVTQGVGRLARLQGWRVALRNGESEPSYVVGAPKCEVLDRLVVSAGAGQSGVLVL